MTLNSPLNNLVGQLRAIRESKAISRTELEKKLILGPGWIEEFETGRTVPRLDVFFAILNELDMDIGRLDLRSTREIEFSRTLQAKKQDRDLLISFPYGKYDAYYLLKDATEGEFDEVLSTLRNGLAGIHGEGDVATQIKANAVARTFLRAMELWKKANPSDVWWFIVYRAFLDPYNHPASWARLNLDQSWKRTGGWALEKVLASHYGKPLANHGIRIFIAENDIKQKLLSQISSVNRIEADKADVLLTTQINGSEKLFGIIHVKASFAERRTDDVPLSRDLIEAGYYSPLWTMDCKSSPAVKPFNKGELGVTRGESEDGRSAKRKDIEDDGFFSVCYSYNANTRPTPKDQDTKSVIKVCDFNQTNDDFVKGTVEARDGFVANLK
jgi:transcriptional regulator with XRE-family HTH domain